MRNSQERRRVIDQGLRDLGFQPFSGFRAHWAIIRANSDGGILVVEGSSKTLYESRHTLPVLNGQDTDFSPRYIKMGEKYRFSLQPSVVYEHGTDTEPVVGDRMRHDDGGGDEM